MGNSLCGFALNPGIVHSVGTLVPRLLECDELSRLQLNWAAAA
jgi:hypothetical protein